MKNTLSLLLSTLIMLQLIGSVQAAFTDVPKDAWFTPYIIRMQDLGIISGYRDKEGNLTGTFGPANTLTKGQTLKILVETKLAANILKPAYIIPPLPKKDTHWASGYRSSLIAQNVTSTPPESQLNEQASRAFVITLTAEMLSLSTGSSTFTDTSDQKISAVADTGIINGYPDGSFGPNNPVLRAEMAKIGTNILDYLNGNLEAPSLNKNLSSQTTSGSEWIPLQTDPPEKESSSPFTFIDYTPNTLSTWQSSGNPFALYFTAPWCPTCRALETKMDQQMDKFPANTAIINVDYDTNHGLRVEYGITVQTSFIFFDAKGNQTEKKYNPSVDEIIQALTP
jgi:thiol-disulfide isomerase/thioredoxin